MDLFSFYLSNFDYLTSLNFFFLSCNFGTQFIFQILLLLCAFLFNKQSLSRVHFLVLLHFARLSFDVLDIFSMNIFTLFCNFCAFYVTFDQARAICLVNKDFNQFQLRACNPLSSDDPPLFFFRETYFPHPKNFPKKLLLGKKITMSVNQI